MFHPYSTSPYIQNAMAHAVQAIMSGGPLPANCFVTTIPIQQAQQMFPQMMNYGIGGSAYMYNPQAAYYGQLYQPQIAQYPYNLPPPVSNVLVPHTNYPPQVYDNQNYNYPVVPYDYSNKNGSSKKHRHSKHDPNIPHSNVYNSSSFDSEMRNLSWSRLFADQQHRRQSKQQRSGQTAIIYNGKDKQQNESSDTFTITSSSGSGSGSSSTTSDETIRRVNVMRNQPSAPSTTSKQQTKGSLPFKYSSEFVPGNNKQQQQQQHQQQKSQKSNKKEMKVRPDDVFFIKKP